MNLRGSSRTVVHSRRYEEAKGIYSFWRDIRNEDGVYSSDIFIKDLDELEQLGITHPDGIRIRAFLKK